VLKEFNLLVSTQRNRENECISELWYHLKELGDPKVHATKTPFPGLIVARTSLDPFSVVHFFRNRARERPWDFRTVLKVIPIEKVVGAQLDVIVSTAVELALKKISPEDTYRVTVNKRGSMLKKREIIDSIASRLEYKVDLENPSKIVQVEIISDLAGISVLTPDDIFSLVKIRRESSFSRVLSKEK